MAFGIKRDKLKCSSFHLGTTPYRTVCFGLGNVTYLMDFEIFLEVFLSFLTTALVLVRGPGCRGRARWQNTKFLILSEICDSYVLSFWRFVLPSIPERNRNQAHSTSYSALTSRKRKRRNDTTHRLKTRSCCVNNVTDGREQILQE